MKIKDGLHMTVMAEITESDRERVRLLRMISSSRDGFNMLSLEQIKRLQAMLEKKDYSHDKKAQKSKKKMLKRINVRIYELEEGRGIWG